MKRPFILFSVWFFLAGSLFGQSLLIFPRLSFEEATLTGVAVLNPNAEAAAVTFTAYDDKGQVLAAEGFENPRQITIEPDQQFADVTVSLFGTLPSDTVGWFSAASDSSDLTGFFLYLDFPDFIFFDGADLPILDTQLVFPEVRLAEGFTTEINVVNPGARSAAVLLSLQSGETSLGAELIEIPARGVVRLNVADVFAEAVPAGSEILPDPAIVSVDSDEEVAGFGFVRQPEGDLLGLNARPRDEQLNWLFFPQLAVGEIIRSELSLDNLSAQATLVTLTAHQENGDLFGPGDISTNPVSLALEPGEVLRLDMADTFGFVGDAVRQGWLEVSSTEAAMQGALSYSLPGTGAFAAVASTSQGTRQAAFSHLATDQGFFTGLALLNSAKLATDVRIVALSQAGEILGTAARTLKPGERTSQLLGVDLIPQAAGQSGGVVYVGSTVPIFLTSLFGRLEGSGVLANIAAQPVPNAYRPDAGIGQSRINPPLAAVAPGGQLNFLLESEGGENPIWKVNGDEGGSALLGTITTGGVYRAPANSPLRLPVTVTAEVADQTASASVDVISRQILVAGLGEVQSVAYLQGLERLLVVELGATVTSAHTPQGIGSLILDVTDGNRTVIQELAGEEISKILAYVAPNGGESLLMAGRGTGQIYRVDLGEPGSEVSRELIASGLNAPVAMAIDATTGDLIVAEADRLSRIPAARLSPQGASAQGPPAGGNSLLEEVVPRGVEVDGCTGDIYFSDGVGQSIQKLDRLTGEVSTVVELIDPTQLLGIPRAGESCPDGFHLFVVEPTPEQVTRVVPAVSLASLYAAAPGVKDLAFVPAGVLAGSESLLAAEQPVGGGQVEQILVPEIYQTDTINPPLLAPCIGQVQIQDPSLEGALRQSLGLDLGEPITCRTAGALTQLLALNLGILGLEGLEAFVNLRRAFLTDNQVSDVAPLAGLSDLNTLDLINNQVAEIAPLADLTRLHTLHLNSNQISDVSPLASLTRLETLNLHDNQIDDISALSGLPLLQNLSLCFNRIEDVGPLAGLTDLAVVTLCDNQINDITPLAGLSDLLVLNLDNNQVTDLTTLVGFTTLTSLRLGNNQISDISPLSGLLNLVGIVIPGNQISDLTPLAALATLGILDLSSNQIGNIATLTGLTNLRELRLPFNQISDISPVAGLINLRTLTLGSNQVDDLTALANLTRLEVLSLRSNQVSDLAVLEGLTRLRTLDLSQNQVTDIAPLVANLGLAQGDNVNLQGNLLGAEDCANITALIDRGALVQIEAGVCP